VAQAIQRGRSEQLVRGEGLFPFVEVEVTGDNCCRPLVALGDEIVEILVGGRAKGLQAKVMDDQERHAGERGELALVVTGGAGGVMSRLVSRPLATYFSNRLAPSGHWPPVFLPAFRQSGQPTSPLRTTRKAERPTKAVKAHQAG
jgi:hypothetical protein